MSEDHNTCVYHGRSVFIMSYRADVRRNPGRGVRGAKPPGKAGGFGGPLGPPRAGPPSNGGGILLTKK